jgi:hypothetical protein
MSMISLHLSYWRNQRVHMSSADAWKLIIKQRKSQLTGGYFKHFAHGEGVYLGPIKNLEVKGNYLIVTTEWTAYNDASGTWKKVTGSNANTFRLDISHEGFAPESHKDYVLYGGFSQKGSTLNVWLLNKGLEEPGFDPSKVEGLHL